MRRLSALVLVGVATAAVSVTTAAPAFAEERVCRGTIGAVTVDNLRVPANATCTLEGTYVKGTVTVETGATLTARSIRVVGNVQAVGSRLVTVGASRVGGSVQIKQGGGATVAGTRITGDLQYDAMTQLLRANRNVVGGSIQVVGNTGGVRVNDNRITGALQCKENRPAPTGSGNVAGEGKEGQCRNL